jgi:hypothetical protein
MYALFIFVAEFNLLLLFCVQNCPGAYFNSHATMMAEETQLTALTDLPTRKHYCQEDRPPDATYRVTEQLLWLILSGPLFKAKKDRTHPRLSMVKRH